MASTSETSVKQADKLAEDMTGEFTGKAREESLRIGKIMFAIALAPLIMQACASTMLSQLCSLPLHIPSVTCLSSIDTSITSMTYLNVLPVLYTLSGSL